MATDDVQSMSEIHLSFSFPVKDQLFKFNVNTGSILLTITEFETQSPALKELDQSVIFREEVLSVCKSYFLKEIIVFQLQPKLDSLTSVGWLV